MAADDLDLFIARSSLLTYDINPLAPGRFELNLM